MLQWIAQGLSNQEIAVQLTLSVETIRWYVRQIFDKLRVNRRRAAVAVAQRLGLLKTEISVPDGALIQALPVGDNPYKGLRAFQQADAHQFFGREIITRHLVDRLAQTGEFARFLAVVGPSGSGKSSLVRAGLIPALRRGELPGAENWFIADLLPGSHPFDELELALLRVAVTQPVNLIEQLQRDERGLLRSACRILPDDQSQLLLVIDQFEELFTRVADPKVTRRFLDLLYTAVTDPRSQVRVVITLRADFYDRPLAIPDFSTLMRARTEVVVPLTPSELERAIVQPAQEAGVSIESGLTAALIAAVNEQPGILPLLQYTLTELYDRREGRVMTLRAYQRSGGIAAVLSRQADMIYYDLDEQERALTRQMFLRLVTLGEGTESLRRRVRRSELAALASETRLVGNLIDTFGANGLLTFDRDPVTRGPTVEVAHEALLREWERLRVWLEESRGDIRQQRMLAGAAADWESAGREDSYLLSGARLAQFEGWAVTAKVALTPDEHQFLDASLTERVRQQARQQHLRQTVFAAISMVAAVMAILALLANSQRSRAEISENQARQQAAILLAAQSESELGKGYYDRAVLLALEALKNYPYTPQSEHALGQAVTYNRALQLFTGHASTVTGADWSPDGTKIATTSADNTLRIWKPTTGESISMISLPRGITGNLIDMGLTVKWSPDGKQLLTITGDRFLLGSQDYDLIWWDAATGTQIRTIQIPNKAVPAAGEGVSTGAGHYTTGAAAAFAPRSGRLATVGGDNTAIIWDASLAAPALVLTGHVDAVNGVDWAPDETHLATASEDGTVRIWDVLTGKELMVLTGHEGAVKQILWSPDGTQLATAGKDGLIRFWDARTGKSVKTLNPNADMVLSLAWSRDGMYLAAGTNDAKVRLWNAVSGEMIAQFSGHEKYITFLDWSPIDDRLVSAGADGRAYVWNAAPSTAVLSFPDAYYGALYSDWSSDGRYYVVTAGDWWAGSVPGNLAIWDVPARKPLVENLAPLSKDWHWYYAFFSPDDRLLLAGGMKPFGTDLTGASTASVIEARTGKIVRTYTVDNHGEAGFIRTLAWSPDGTKVAAGMGLTGTVAIWDFETGALLREVRHCGGSIADWVVAIVWSPDGKKIATACGSQSVTGWPYWISVWDSTTFKLLFTLPDPNPPAGYLSVTWSPDSTRILTTGGSDELGSPDNPVRVWNGNTGAALLAILRHTGQAWWGSWSPNGRRFATGSSDGTTRVWDATSGAELLTLSTPNKWSAQPEWSPNGDLLAVAASSLFGPTRSAIWRVWQSTDDLIGYAYKCCVFRDLSHEERSLYGL